MSNVEQVLDYYSRNFNCSQAIFTTYAKELGIEEETALKIATQFGGGARKGELCGAVSGALMVLGLKYGHCHGDDVAEKIRAYEIATEYMNRFIKKYKTVVCRELLGYDLSKPEDMAVIKEKNLFKTTCPQMIASATLILEEMIEEIDGEVK